MEEKTCGSLKEAIDEFGVIGLDMKTEIGAMELSLDYEDFANYLLGNNLGCVYTPDGEIYILSKKEYSKEMH
ncbi:hypothetical protein HOC13_02705 [Candidatus Woesearchaeota archaeon]|jgi:hypothetical protein|nr:hypothetical protein [Candidatus Woesearchaeota archaeon]